MFYQKSSPKKYPAKPKTIIQKIIPGLIPLIILACNFTTRGQVAPTAPEPTAAPTMMATEIPIQPTQVPTEVPVAIEQPTEEPLEPTATDFQPVEIPIEEYQFDGDRVTIDIPIGGRFVVVGDSLSYGSTISGQSTYEDICENRWPFVEQLAVETGIMATSSLDRGDSMKTPFFSQEVRGKTESYCTPPPETPTTSTTVPGSTTNEWLADILSYEVLQKDLANPDNPVVLLHLVADVYAHKISKPFVTEEMYVNNIGQILSQLADANKIVYLGLIPHVQVGSFIPSGELAEINQRIDVFNQLLVEIAGSNGYQDVATGTWVDFGVQIIEQDGIRLWVHTVQPGPDLAILSDTKLEEFYARDGLHYHPDGYNLIGQAWAEALKAPVRATKYLLLEQ